MSTRRTAKVAEAIRQVISRAILFGVRDPRVKNVTVLSVETPTDLRTSKVYVSVLGDEKIARLTMKGLEACRGFLQGKIAEILDLRYTPVLTFILDDGIKKSAEASLILRKLDAEDAARKTASEGADGTESAVSDEVLDDDDQDALDSLEEQDDEEDDVEGDGIMPPDAI